MTTEAQVVQVRTLDWKEMVMRAWAKEWTKPDPAYEFSTNRTFDDPKDGGPYDQD